MHEDTEERAIDGRFPSRAIEENVGRLAPKFESDAFERVRRTLDDNFSDRRAARKCDFVHAGMLHECASCRLAKPVDNVDYTGWQAQFFKPVDDFYHAERRLFGRLKDAGD